MSCAIKERQFLDGLIFHYLIIHLTVVVVLPNSIGAKDVTVPPVLGEVDVQRQPVVGLGPEVVFVPGGQVFLLLFTHQSRIT